MTRHRAIAFSTNAMGGYTLKLESDKVLKGMQLHNARLDSEKNILEIVLKPVIKNSEEDSFADQVVQEVEEYEQLALDI